MCGENPPTGYLLPNWMKDTSDFLSLIQDQNYILLYALCYFCSDFVLLTSRLQLNLYTIVWGSFVCQNILLRGLIVEFNTQRSRRLLLVSTLKHTSEHRYC